MYSILSTRQNLFTTCVSSFIYDDEGQTGTSGRREDSSTWAVWPMALVSSSHRAIRHQLVIYFDSQRPNFVGFFSSRENVFLGKARYAFSRNKVCLVLIAFHVRFNNMELVIIDTGA